jgi:hypothetical protein
MDTPGSGLIVIAASKPIIEFKKAIEALECYPEAGMRARLTDAKYGDGYIEIFVSYEEFESTNRTLESATFIDSSGRPRLTAREAGLYRPIDSIYIGLDWQEYLTVVHSGVERLLKAFNERKDKGLTYLQWLEKTALAALDSGRGASE